MKSFLSIVVLAGLVVSGCAAEAKEDFHSNENAGLIRFEDGVFSVEQKDIVAVNEQLEAELEKLLRMQTDANDLFELEQQVSIMAESNVLGSLRGSWSHDTNIVIAVEVPQGIEISSIEIDVAVTQTILRPFMRLIFIIGAPLLLLTVLLCARFEEEEDEGEDEVEYEVSDCEDLEDSEEGEGENEDEDYFLEVKSDALNVSPQEQLKTPLL